MNITQEYERFTLIFYGDNGNSNGDIELHDFHTSNKIIVKINEIKKLQKILQTISDHLNDN